MGSNTITHLPYKIEKGTKIQKFWDELNNDNLMTTKCKNCSELHFPPRTLCPKCYSTKTEWVQLGLSGKVESFTYVRTPPLGFENPFYLLVVRLEDLDKPITGRYVGDKDIYIGKKVVVAFEQIEKQNFLVFKEQVD